MGDEQKEIVRIASFWIDTWLRSQYKSLETCYVVHEAVAQGGGPAHLLPPARERRHEDLLGLRADRRHHRQRFPPDSWNIYLFHFSDGDNGDGRDTDAVHGDPARAPAARAQPVLLRPGALAYGGGQFKTDLDEALPRRARS